MLVGCGSPESSLGELPGTSGESTDATDATGSTGEADSLTPGGDSTGVNVGAPCELGFVPEAIMLDPENAACDSGMCLYANTTSADTNQPCTESPDCDGFTRGVICGESGFCQLDPEYIVARTMCTDTCVEDADCAFVDGSSCLNGFICVPIVSIGDLCCQPMCACRDDFFEPEAMPLEQQCADGTALCCQQQQPTPEACG
jgi:hypothetical protein